MIRLEIDEIDEIIERHQHYLKGDCENWEDMQAEFINIDLQNISFRGKNLSGAIFKWSNLREADFCGAVLNNAFFSQTNLQHAYFNEASLMGTCFFGSFINGASFIDANLKGGEFRQSSCIDVDFSFGNLFDVHFYNTPLYHARFNYTSNIPYIPMVCPEEGAFIGWKKVHSCIIKLEIPAEAKRSSATTRKCRCEYAKVLEIYNPNGELAKITEVTNNSYSQPTIYKVGEMVYPDSFDENRWNECSHGIHFFINKQEAIEYGW